MALPHTWIILVIVKQHLVQIGRVDGPIEYLSCILAAIRSTQCGLKKDIYYYQHGLRPCMHPHSPLGSLIPAIVGHWNLS